MKMSKHPIYTEYGLLNGKFFADEYKNWGIPEETRKVLLEGTENPKYKSTWKNFLATTTHEYNGVIYTLEEDDNHVLYLVFPEETGQQEPNNEESA